ncbi:Uncharacterized protein HZ326_22429 [Fusarium oxysporum f. sp. albedinis]|nr:Uncharacterized protein HZ326_22429 [Fusarium oxysporum f. sp. albedinis]
MKGLDSALPTRQVEYSGCPNGRAGVQNSTLAQGQSPSLLSGTAWYLALTLAIHHLVCDSIDMGLNVEIQGSCRRETASGHCHSRPCSRSIDEVQFRAWPDSK